MKRMIEMVGSPFPTPGGYPEVGEQAVLDRHAGELDRRLADLGVIPEAGPSAADEDDGNFGFMFDGPGDVGDSYLD
jgi:hypothetical protein